EKTTWMTRPLEKKSSGQKATPSMPGMRETASSRAKAPAIASALIATADHAHSSRRSATGLTAARRKGAATAVPLSGIGTSSEREQVRRHEVDDDARDRHVHPQRPGPAGDPAVPVELPGQRPVEGDRNQRGDDHRADDVGDEDGEVDRPDHAL